MNTSQFSKYATEARKTFIVAVSPQPIKFSITAKSFSEFQVQRDVFLVKAIHVEKPEVG